MTSFRPLTQLDTHDVFNQPPVMESLNLFSGDRAFCEAVSKAGGAAHMERLSRYGAKTGSAEVIEWGYEANRQTPTLDNFDRYGQRIDEVRFHPAYHQLMALGLDNGFASVAWDGSANGHVAHAAILYMTSQADCGTTCPMTMTYAAVPALATEPALAKE